jgi:WhiB family redox-sensing transcriptional regulator
MNDDPWDRRGCRDQPPDMWFANPRSDSEAEQADYQRAKALCGTCPIRVSCLEWALSFGDMPGIWGGTVQDERKKILRTRGQVANFRPDPTTTLAAPPSSYDRTSRFHVVTDEGAMLCRRGSIPRMSKSVPAVSVPAGQRCSLYGCAMAWRILDEQQGERCA